MLVGVDKKKFVEEYSFDLSCNFFHFVGFEPLKISFHKNPSKFLFT